MPEQAGDFDAVGEAFGIGLPHLAAEQPEVADDQRAANDVQRVEAGQGEIDRVVGAVARAVVADLLNVGRRDGDVRMSGMSGFRMGGRLGVGGFSMTGFLVSRFFGGGMEVVQQCFIVNDVAVQGAKMEFFQFIFQ